MGCGHDWQAPHQGVTEATSATRHARPALEGRQGQQAGAVMNVRRYLHGWSCWWEGLRKARAKKHGAGPQRWSHALKSAACFRHIADNIVIRRDSRAIYGVTEMVGSDHDTVWPGTGPKHTTEQCLWCGLIHSRLCPAVKAIEYFQNGAVRRVEFKTETDFRSVIPKMGPNTWVTS